MAFHCLHSNDPGVLSGALARLLEIPGDPLRPRLVVVSSRGMAAWLQQQLALRSRAGIAANVRFLQPNELIRPLLTDTASDTDPFARESLDWRIYRLLHQADTIPELAPLRPYLAAETEDAAALRRFDLARRLADLFDQYQLYRPDWMMAWAQGSGTPGIDSDADRWQIWLWQQLVAAGPSRSERLFRRIRELTTSGAAATAGAQDVFLFGVGALPPMYIRLLLAASASRNIVMLLRNPCPDYWLDDVRHRLDADSAEEGGNPLLASMGGMCREQLAELFGQCEGGGHAAGGRVMLDDERLYRPPANEDLLLGRLQTAIYERRPLLPEAPASDGSVRIHRCHSRLRELEVLRDVLLDWFSRDPQPAARDIVVMAPDISEYAPWIDAVFGADETVRIPYTVADRTAMDESPVIRAFLLLLQTSQSRFAASEIYDLLALPEVAAAFGFTADGLRLARQLIAQSGIRWGRDAEQRRQAGFTALGGANSWQAGLDRMLAGAAVSDAVADDGGPLAADCIAALPGIESGTAAEAGRLARFFRELAALTAPEFHQPTDAATWRERLQRHVLDRFFVEDDDTAPYLAAVREELETLALLAADADEPLPLSVVASWLNGALGDRRGRGGFCRGGVTFCSMLPMRSIPAAGVCLLGMNDTDFPRQDRAPAFDLMARRRRRCDRSRRLDDRYLFLEAVLSPQRWLHISYLGRSIADNSELPASPLVTELLDDILAACPETQRPSFADALTRDHRLHGFDPTYFQPGAPASFAENQSRAAAVLARVHAAGDRAAPPHLTGRLPMPAEGSPLLSPDLNLLIDCWLNPARSFVRLRLGAQLPWQTPTIEDNEPETIAGLDRYSINQRLFTAVVHGQPEQALPRLRAEGALPPGSAGDRLVAERLKEAAAFANATVPGAAPGGTVADAVRQIRSSGIVHPLHLPPIPVIDADGNTHHLQLHGNIVVTEGRALSWRMGNLKAKDDISLLLRHLAANAAGIACDSMVIGLGNEGTADVRTFAAGDADTARRDLTLLLQLYAVGLCQPLPFVPAASFAWAKSLADSDDPDKARSAADTAWLGGFTPAYDGIEVPANRWVYGDYSLVGRPADGSITTNDGREIPLCFESIAEAVFAISRRWGAVS